MPGLRAVDVKQNNCSHYFVKQGFATDAPLPASPPPADGHDAIKFLAPAEGQRYWHVHTRASQPRRPAVVNGIKLQHLWHLFVVARGSLHLPGRAPV